MKHIQPVCKNCGKTKGNHRSETHECPSGQKARIGYTSFGPNVYDEKPLTKKQLQTLKDNPPFTL